jgi:hypothetical protein
MNDDLEVEDILANVKKKKKINSKGKEKRSVNQLVHVLNKRFSKLLSPNPEWGKFSRSVGSGNRWGQRVGLSKSNLQTYSGDLSCPENFKWVIESKAGYDNIDLCSAIDGGNAELDDWFKQVGKDAARSGRQPMVIWKKDYKPRVAFITADDFVWMLRHKPNPFEYRIEYRDWIGVSFDVLMEFPDKVFFDL